MRPCHFEAATALLSDPNFHALVVHTTTAGSETQPQSQPTLDLFANSANAAQYFANCQSEIELAMLQNFTCMTMTDPGDSGSGEWGQVSLIPRLARCLLKHDI